MTIDTNTMISITEANQNFSKVTRMVDKHGYLRLKDDKNIIVSHFRATTRYSIDTL